MRRLFAVLLALMLMAAIVPMAAMACALGTPDCTGIPYMPSPNGDGTHTFTCSGCKKPYPALPCVSDDTATCMKQASCIVCHSPCGSRADHRYTAFDYNESEHWNVCKWCLDVADSPAVPHSFTYSQEGDRCKKSCACGYSELVDHALTHVEAKDPTCTSVGWYAYDKCNNCGYSTYNEIPKLSHNVPNRHTNGATCTDTGSVHGLCTICNEDVEVESLPALGHSPAKAWSTDEEGNHWHDCLNACGSRFDFGPHTPGEKTVTIQAATCEADGSERVDTYCTVCNTTLTEGTPTTVSATGHTIDKVKWAYDGDSHWHPCTNVIAGSLARTTGTCPYREDEAPHIPATGVWTPGSEATCYSKATERNICSVCYAHMEREVGELKSHTYGEWVDDGNGKTHTRTCTTCPEESAATETKDHNMKPTEAAKAPTCTEDGWNPAQKCEDCGAVQARVNRPATGHRNVITVEATPATCTETGTRSHYKCSDCGTLFEDEAAMVPTTLEKLATPPLGHQNVNHVKAADPTCTADGNVEYWSCSDCGKLYLDAAMTKQTTAEDVLIKATGHDYKGWTWTRWKHWQKCGTCGHETEHKDHHWVRNAANSNSKQNCYDCNVCGATKITYFSWDNPKTGDYIMIAVAVMVISAAGLAGTAIYSKKRKRD